jgi:hypothetical protein
MYGPITAMPEPKVYEFSKHIGAICVRANKNLHTLDAALGIDPMLLLRMINGREAPTKAVIAGLARSWTQIRGISRSWLRRSSQLKGTTCLATC